jgi:hypothetical protein
MKTSNRVYRIPLDSDFDLKFKEFQKNLSPNERIISATAADNTYIVMTEVTSGDRRNLLLEEMRGRANGGD